MSEMTRDRAIEILRDDASGASLWELAEAVEMGIKALTEQRPHGEWIVRRDMQGAHIYSVCSKCNVPYLDIEFPNYCPNCGADMRKKEGDEKCSE